MCAAPPLYRISIQAEDFDVAIETQRLTAERHDIGAVCTFTGLCRSESQSLTALELEHYPGMAEAEIERVVQVASTRWPLMGIRVIHRFGKIAPGGNIVLVITTSAHRRAAFEAAEFLMDFLKTRAPFWKKEHKVDGTTSNWVDAKDADDLATTRWDIV